VTGRFADKPARWMGSSWTGQFAEIFAGVWQKTGIINMQATNWCTSSSLLVVNSMQELLVWLDTRRKLQETGQWQQRLMQTAIMLIFVTFFGCCTSFKPQKN